MNDMLHLYRPQAAANAHMLRSPIAAPRRSYTACSAAPPRRQTDAPDVLNEAMLAAIRESLHGCQCKTCRSWR